MPDRLEGEPELLGPEVGVVLDPGRIGTHEVGRCPPGVLDGGVPQRQPARAGGGRHHGDVTCGHDPRGDLAAVVGDQRAVAEQAGALQRFDDRGVGVFEHVGAGEGTGFGGEVARFIHWAEHR